MGLNDNLGSIKWELREQNELLKQDKELKKLEKDYKADIKSALEQVFYDRFEKISDYKKCYNYFIINKEEYIEQVIIALNDVDVYRINFELSMYEDVKTSYYKVLKDIYNEYNLQTTATSDNMQKLFEAKLKKIFDNMDYDVCINFLYNINNRENIIETLSSNKKEKDYLNSIYTKTVNRFASDYKKYQKKQPIQKPPRQVKQKSSSMSALAPLCIIGGAVFGLGRGLYKASKK